MPTALAERPGAAERAPGAASSPASGSSGRRGRSLTRTRQRGRCSGWKLASRPAPNRPGFSSGPIDASALVSVGGYDSPGPGSRSGVVFTTKRHYTLAGTTVAVRDSSTTQVSYLLGDQLGSTTVSVNSSTGAVATQRYLAYGAIRSSSGTQATDRGFIGQVKDGSTGLQYLNARYYDPAIGRFTAPDPVVDLANPGSLDAYGYGLGNPVTLSDPTGLFVLTMGGGGSSPQIQQAARRNAMAYEGRVAGDTFRHDSLYTALKRNALEIVDGGVRAAKAGGASLSHTLTCAASLRTNCSAAIEDDGAMRDALRHPGATLKACVNNFNGCVGAILLAAATRRALASRGLAGTSATGRLTSLDDLAEDVALNVDDAIQRAAEGRVRFPTHDGKPYLNSDGLLPSRPDYTEWTAAASGQKRGLDRVIIAGNPANPDAIYYWDHVNPPVRIG